MNKKKISPYVIIILGFIGLILIGSLLLMLPFATYNHVSLSYIDALFTATSAVCVTGLSAVPTLAGTYTLFGKIVIAILMEIGGLGFVTIVIFIFTLLGLKIGIQDRFLIKESLNQNSLKGIVKLVRFTVFVTLIVQTLGAIINFLVFNRYFSFGKALGISVFHAISSFNNAGFDLFTEGTSLIPYQNPLLLINTAVLIVIGGIGFIVINDIITNKSWKKLSVHSKIVLLTSLCLIVFGALILKLLEWNNITWMQAFFTSVAARTAGFAVVDFNTITSSALIVVMALMYIGASPASTGGGVKTTTFYTVIKYISSFARGRLPLTFKRRIATGSVIKAFILVVFSLTFIFLAIFALTLTEQKHLLATATTDNLERIVFEVFSAFGTVGNSMGITAHLTWGSKLIICLTMFFGRLGPITIISAWNRNWNIDANVGIKYLEEKMIIG
ncbi:MAG TPA: potassium transporter TrkG [Bacilli bacterium]|nr:MAG: Ktr system potassium uptake protein B [Tenericutes bacterium ADurb.BinA124]HNZ50414.1 potassium transporter TrkG [Bacilli bacterium]HOH18160.1 potassium transporter TrkG [Bacilli bacterium]HPX83852.1 potassium transporter TrkG [Bacilli bacterium]HQC74908.1 potassium transporter TrkG [Bacilli bacterium]